MISARLSVDVRRAHNRKFPNLWLRRRNIVKVDFLFSVIARIFANIVSRTLIAIVMNKVVYV